LTNAFTTTRAALAALALGAAALVTGATPAGACPSRAISPGPKSFKLVERESGSVNYYRVVNSPEFPFIRSEYLPRYETAVVGFQVPEGERGNVAGLSWSWRPQKFPAGGDECKDGKGDSAAVVYVTWKRGLRWYTLKYVWSSVGTKGMVCDRKRNPFVAQDTVILESGGTPGVWKQESIDLRAAFRKHFADGDPKASVPEFAGIGLMSDGDQTKSESAADYGNFNITLSGGCK
jgi:hypothetical protein